MQSNVHYGIDKTYIRVHDGTDTYTSRRLPALYVNDLHVTVTPSRE